MRYYYNGINNFIYRFQIGFADFWSKNNHGWVDSLFDERAISEGLRQNIFIEVSETDARKFIPEAF